jgi:hypothetical protein
MLPIAWCKKLHTFVKQITTTKTQSNDNSNRNNRKSTTSNQIY